MDIKRPESKQPIPNNAKKVFSGKMFDVYQWEQELFNGEKTIFEKIKRADTVNIIPVTEDGKIILAEQEQPGTKPFIGALGGQIDTDENPIDTARRELLEETGHEAKEFILWDSTQPIEKIDWAIYTFIAKGCLKVQEQSTDAGEKIKLVYLTFDEFLKTTAQENYRDKEVSLKFFYLMNNPSELEKTKKLFLK